MASATGVEVIACFALLVAKDGYRRGVVLAGLGGQFLAYHGAKLLIAPHGLCPCLGSAWKWLGLTEAAATSMALGFALTIAAAGVLLMVCHGRRSGSA